MKERLENVTQKVYRSSRSARQKYVFVPFLKKDGAAPFWTCR
jgi:hypothetical protein